MARHKGVNARVTLQRKPSTAGTPWYAPWKPWDHTDREGFILNNQKGLGFLKIKDAPPGDHFGLCGTFPLFPRRHHFHRQQAPSNLAGANAFLHYTGSAHEKDDVAAHAR